MHLFIDGEFDSPPEVVIAIDGQDGALVYSSMDEVQSDINVLLEAKAYFASLAVTD